MEDIITKVLGHIMWLLEETQRLEKPENKSLIIKLNYV
jgi:hypothetical protein